MENMENMTSARYTVQREVVQNRDSPDSYDWWQCSCRGDGVFRWVDTMASRDPASFTVAELKEKLRKRGLATAGAKAELITRLMSVDPAGEWTNEQDESEIQHENIEEGTVSGTDELETSAEEQRRS
ncbi:hypothetical protein DMN91_006962 [Ooceraea biroi]|uniref:SAP domain-containing protein n=1 Tax=Ooceraea biroi TaxID=2015173 RepID=A0A3L8DIU6_OOCBI|nr:hypothetical protein DMN91_006962 [Ooceraea biroi]